MISFFFTPVTSGQLLFRHPGAILVGQLSSSRMANNWCQIASARKTFRHFPISIISCFMFVSFWNIYRRQHRDPLPTREPWVSMTQWHLVEQKRFVDDMKHPTQILQFESNPEGWQNFAILSPEFLWDFPVTKFLDRTFKIFVFFENLDKSTN